MNCNRCNFELPDDSVYCGRCGSRVDGKKACSSCGRDICEEYVYCNYCGARVDGKQVCECGNVFEGNYCFACGKEAKGVKKQVEKKSGGSKLSFIFTKIAEGALALSAFFALVFVFFIGVGAKIPEELASLIQSEGVEFSNNTNIFYFFGEYFKELKTFGDAPLQYEWFNDLFFSQTELFGWLGITVSALTLLSVVTFSVLAIVFYALGWAKKTKVDFSKFALGSIVCFFVGALVFHALSRVAVSSNAVGVLHVDIATKFNGATATAMILIAELLLIYFVFRVLAKGKAGLGFAPIFKTVTSFVTVAFALVVAFVTVNQGLTVDVQERTTEISVTTGFIQSNIVWIATFGDAFDNTVLGYAEATASLSVSTALYSVAQLTQILALAFTGITVMNSVKKGADGKKTPVVVYAALSTGFSLLTLVLSCVGYGFFTEAYAFFDDVELTTSFACEIVAFVFSLLLLGGAIATAVVDKNSKN